MWQYNTSFMSHANFHKYIDKYVGPSGKYVYKYKEPEKEKPISPNTGEEDNKQIEEKTSIKDKFANAINILAEKAKEAEQKAYANSKKFARDSYAYYEGKITGEEYQKLWKEYENIYGEDQTKQIWFVTYHMYLADIGEIEPKPIIEENRWLLK